MHLTTCKEIVMYIRYYMICEDLKLNTLIFVKYNIQLRIESIGKDLAYHKTQDPINLMDMESNYKRIMKNEPCLTEVAAWHDVNEYFEVKR